MTPNNLGEWSWSRPPARHVFSCRHSLAGNDRRWGQRGSWWEAPLNPSRNPPDATISAKSSKASSARPWSNNSAANTGTTLSLPAGRMLVQQRSGGQRQFPRQAFSWPVRALRATVPTPAKTMRTNAAISVYIPRSVAGPTYRSLTRGCSERRAGAPIALSALQHSGGPRATRLAGGWAYAVSRSTISRVGPLMPTACKPGRPLTNRIGRWASLRGARIRSGSPPTSTNVKSPKPSLPASRRRSCHRRSAHVWVAAVGNEER